VHLVILNKFYKDLDKIDDKKLASKIIQIIEDIENAGTLSDIKNLKKMQGFTICYRIKIGEYIIGLYIENNIVELARLVHRKDIYKLFP
jgi:mRNA interferase RelE/StbE